MGRAGIEMVGRVFGSWIVLERTAAPEGGSAPQWWWRCRCSCGTIGVVAGTALRSGRSTRCAQCSHSARGLTRAGTGEDLTGRTFGDWTVLKRAEDRVYVRGDVVNRKPMWECRCRCGTVQDVQGGNLRNGTSKRCRSCGARAGRATRKGS